MSVADNLKLSFNYASAEAAYSSVRAAELMDLLGLSSKKLDENPRKYSVGEQQRLCLLRSILTQPDLLLLDEPTSALDAESSRRVMDLIKHERQERGMAIVLAGHDFVADTDADRLDLAAYRVEPVS
jgi:D-methionine transport system ATP-binding protein